jgi:hypothetical protein
MDSRRPKPSGRWRRLINKFRQPEPGGPGLDTATEETGACDAGSGVKELNAGGRLTGWRWAASSAAAAAAFCVVAVALPAAQFQRYPPHGPIFMDGEIFAPENPNEKAEWTFIRFDYHMNDEFGFYDFQRWAADWPKADRQFVSAVKRLTLIQARSTEHILAANSDQLFNYPWIYVEDPGAWRLTQAQAQRLRQFLLRGGSIMLDDSWGDQERENMAAAVRMILPGRPIEKLANSDPIFHVVYNLDHRIQIPGTRYIWGWRRRRRPDEMTPIWSAVRDDKGRILIFICHNSDTGDAWEWADSPRYPETPATEAFQIGINSVIYAMTH